MAKIWFHFAASKITCYRHCCTWFHRSKILTSGAICDTMVQVPLLVQRFLVPGTYCPCCCNQLLLLLPIAITNHHCHCISCCGAEEVSFVVTRTPVSIPL